MKGRVSTRRRWMPAVAITMAALLSLTACGGEAPPPPSGDSAEGEVEVYSWWGGPGEADGLEALREIFEKRHPNLTFFDAAVAGGSGDKARKLLADQLQANTPPDTFQGHAGAELQDYIKAGELEPLNFLYDEMKLHDAYPKRLVDQITVDGRIYAVPVNIHRSNVLWFNPRVLREAKVAAPPETIPQFIAALEAVKRTGRIPLSIGSEWTAVHVLENVLLASLGTDAYNRLWTTEGEWMGQDMTKALNDFKRIIAYAGPAQADWQPAVRQVADGQAAFTLMGDWAYSYLRNPPDGGLGKTYKADFDWAPAPGTDGTFMWLSDGFTLPRGAPNRNGAVAWLKVVASLEGQDAFNPKKGSIPARADANRSLYTDYLADALQDWNGSKLAGSMQHGVAANDAWRTAINEAVTLFLRDPDVPVLQRALVAAARNSG